MEKSETNLLIIQEDFVENFKTIDLTCVTDKRLSWKAKGIHTYMISRPKAWQIRFDDLKGRSSDGKAALYNGINELITSGYLFRINKRDSKRQIKIWGYFVCRIPRSREQALEIITKKGFELNTTITENLHAENQEVGFREVYKDNKKEGEICSKSVKDKSLTDLNAARSTSPISEPEEIKEKVIKGVKISREPVEFIHTKEELAFHGIPKDIVDVFRFWISSGEPLKNHLLNKGSKTFTRCVKLIGEKIKAGYSPEQIKSSIVKYRTLLLFEFGKFKLYERGFCVGLDQFFGFTEPAEILKENPRLVSLLGESGSWFAECLKLSMEDLREKYTKQATDKFPDITTALKAEINRRHSRGKYTFDEENILRRLSARVYNYFTTVKDFSGVNCNKKYPATCVGYVVGLMERKSIDLAYIPGWVAGEKFMNGEMTAYLREVGVIQDGNDAYAEGEAAREAERRERARIKREALEREGEEGLRGEF